MNVSALAGVLRGAWSAATSASPHEWVPQRPSIGQCAVTALVVQDLCGGELLRGVVGGSSHYWNELSDGRVIDLTRDQFDEFRLDGPVTQCPRSYVLRSPDTRRRYRKLVAAIRPALGMRAMWEVTDG